jgi:hypothetical protein
VTRANSALDRVKALLEIQRQALLAGDLDALADLPDRLGSAMERLAAHRPSAADLAPLTAAASHNARLLVAARQGITRASRRMVGAPALTTYDYRGRQTSATPGGHILSRR